MKGFQINLSNQMVLENSRLSFKLNSSLFLKVILFICFIGSVFSLQALSIFSIYLFFIFSLLKKKRIIKFYKYVTPLILMTSLGLIYSFNNLTKDIIRDFFYFSTPILLVIFGTICSSQLSLHKYISILIYFGLFYSIFYIISFTYYNFQDIYNIEEMRNLIGPGNIITILSFYFLFSNKGNDSFSRFYVLRYFFLFINLLALLLFNSRSYFICFIIFFLYFFQIFPTRIKFSLITAGFFFILLLTTINFNSENFIYAKILNSFGEISMNSGIDLSSDYSNYRAYETFSAINTYLTGNNFNHIVGQGFGKLVDLKFEIQLTDQSWQFIPLLHNGFMYILIKSGMLGVIFFFIFLYRFYPSKRTKSKNKQQTFLRVILKSLVICCILTTFVINGFFNFEMQFLLISLGAFYNYLNNEIISNVKINELNVQ
jgi:hypothetical protein